MKKGFVLISVLFAMGCDSESQVDMKDIPEASNEEASTEEASAEDEDCEITIVDTKPNSGAMGWFYRDSVTLTFSDANPNISIVATNSAGETEPVSFAWDDVRLNATVLPDSGNWSPAETYTLEVSLCGATPTMEFSTSEYGSTMDIADEDLVGNTYFVDLSTANYIEPPGVGALLSLFIDTPLLFGVTAIDGEVIDFEAGLGEQAGSSSDWSIFGDRWSFSNADFTQSPYFYASTDLLNIPFDDVDIPVHGFYLSGTFSPSGDEIGFVEFSGLGDTSNMGLLMGFGTAPDALCSNELFINAGIICEECPTGGAYCVQLTGQIDEASIIPGMDITQ